jgi:hypothetical protein
MLWLALFLFGGIGMAGSVYGIRRRKRG